MRAVLIGAVEGTAIALEAIAAAAGWELAAVATLPPDHAHRHSDYVDLGDAADRCGADLIHVVAGNDDAFVARVAGLRPDMLFVIGWSQLCGPELCAAAGGRVIGYHPAPLPRLRGRGVIPWTILLDEKITASTLFWIDDGVDSGPLLAQQFFHVAPDEVAATLYAKHMAALRRMLSGVLPRLAAGEMPSERQDERLATWAARRRPGDGRINWRRPANEVDRLIRAVSRPYPGAFTEQGEHRLIIWESSGPERPGRHHGLPGQVVARDADGFSVCCGDGGLVRIRDYESGAGRPPALHALLGEAR